MSAKQATQETYSISALSRLTTLDRATIRKRLAEVKPAAEQAKEKLYRLKDALPALIAGASTEMDEAKLRKTQAEADLREHELAVERGEYLPIKEVRDHAVRLFKGIHQRLAVELPRRLAPQLYKADSAELISEIMERETGRVFNDLRNDHKSFL